MYKIEIVEKIGDEQVKVIRRLSDNACIPIDPPKEQFDFDGSSYFVGGNADYAEYLEWVRSGNEAEVVDLTPVKTLAERRQEEYDKRGATTDALVVALWEKEVEGRPEEAARIQAIREQVKLDLPKEIKPVIREWKKQGGVPVIRSSKAQK